MEFIIKKVIWKKMFVAAIFAVNFVFIVSYNSSTTNFQNKTEMRKRASEGNYT
jgi:hypothetical protein